MDKRIYSPRNSKLHLSCMSSGWLDLQNGPEISQELLTQSYLLLLRVSHPRFSQLPQLASVITQTLLCPFDHSLRIISDPTCCYPRASIYCTSPDEYILRSGQNTPGCHRSLWSLPSRHPTKGPASSFRTRANTDHFRIDLRLGWTGSWHAPLDRR